MRVINKDNCNIIKDEDRELIEVCGNNDKANCSVALVTMEANKEDLTHYHDNITEVYYFVSGKGIIVINGNYHDVQAGDCYIIKPNSVHYIKSYTKMEFVCICTPGWTVEHEFVPESVVLGKDELPYDGFLLQKLSEVNNHSVEIVNIDGEYKLPDNYSNFTRMYIVTKGNALAKLNDKTYELNVGNCLYVNKHEVEYLCGSNISMIRIYDMLG